LAPKQELYERIKDQFERLIQNGAYLPGEPLPSLRKVALDLGVNPNTVEKAYQALAEDKMIEIIPKKGAFVTSFRVNINDDLAILNQVITRLKSKLTEEEIITYMKKYIKGEYHD
jgi:GntR family transcriptional regulator